MRSVMDRREENEEEEENDSRGDSPTRPAQASIWKRRIRKIPVARSEEGTPAVWP